jgi:hypothetical protein
LLSVNIARPKIAILAIFRDVFKDVFVTFPSKKKLYFAGKSGKLNPKVFNMFRLPSLYFNFEEIVVLVLTLTSKRCYMGASFRNISKPI